jgi:hypothetical protein
LYEFLAWLEGSTLGHAMREHGVWTYGIVNLVHILAIASLFGSVLILDLRLMGVWRKAPLGAISRATTPIAKAAFGLAALSGACLLATKATEYAGNPFLLIKFPAIALGLANVAVLNSSAAWREHRIRELSAREQSKLVIFGGVSLACWLTAISAGRMIAYW